MASGHKLSTMTSIEGQDVHTIAQARPPAVEPGSELPLAHRKLKNQDTRVR
jgi:hypothetical protein